MTKKILITGATGLIGQRLVNELADQGALVKILTTNQEKAKSTFNKIYIKEIYRWSDYDDPQRLQNIIKDVDAVINLAGTNVSEKRWSKEFKDEIYNSRIDSTKLIVDAIKLSEKKPACLINSSGVGIYGFCKDEYIYEDSALGSDFLAKVCKDWEKEAAKAIEYDVRVVNIRTGIVLDKKGGALQKIIEPFKFHFGAYQGNGKQWFSWIHINDIIRLIIFALENNNLYGSLNSTSPNPVTNKELITTIGNILNVKIILPVPEIVLRIVAGEFAKNLTTGQRVLPEKLLNSGFNFEFPVLKDALEDLLKDKKNTDVI